MKQFLRALLRRTEQATKTDVRYVARGSFWLGMTQASSALVSVVATVAFANLVSPATYGMYRYVLSAYAIITVLALPGLDTALTQSAASGYLGSINQAVKLRRRWSLLASLASLAMAGYYALQGNFTLGAVFAAVALFIPVLEPGALYSSYLNGLKRFRQWSLLDIFSQLGATALIVATIFFTDSVLLIALAYLVGYGVARTVATASVRRAVPKDSAEDPDLLRYSKSVSLFQIVSRVTASIDQIVLYHLLGPVQVALFALASAVPNRIQSLLRIGGIIAFPKLAERSMDDIRRALPRKLLLLTLAIAAAAGLYILAAPYLFAWFFPKYLPALGYSKVLVLYTFSALTYPISAAFFAHKNVTPGYAMSIVNLGVKVVALAVFVPLVGIWGAVISTLAASASTIVIAGYYLLRRSRVQPQPLG